MKKNTIAGLTLIVLGILFLVVSLYGNMGEGGGYFAISVAYPMIVIGILLMFSIVGAILVFIGEIIVILTSLMHTSFTKPEIGVLSWLILIVYGFFIVGILYSLFEGIIKLVKFIKKPK